MKRAMILLACASTLGLTACGGGVTVEGRPTPTAPGPGASSSPTEIRPVRTPTPTPTPTEERRTAPGPEFPARMVSGALTIRVVTYSWQHSGAAPKSAPPKDSYLILDVELTALDGSPAVLPANFKAQQSGGPLIPPAFGRDGTEPVLANTTLQAGRSVRGILSFDLPQAETTLLVFDELGTKVGETKIPAA